MKALAVALSLLVAAAALCQQDSTVTSLPEGPHQSLYLEGGCADCHITNEGRMEPHLFVTPISVLCLRESCHTPEKIGRSHPVGVNARQSKFIEEVPETLPLEEDERISCGSCHQPHGAWLSSTRCYPKQQPEVLLVQTVAGEQQEIPYFRTYFLRIPGDSSEGFTALCNSCHPR